MASIRHKQASHCFAICKQGPLVGCDNKAHSMALRLEQPRYWEAISCKALSFESVSTVHFTVTWLCLSTTTESQHMLN